MKYRAEIDGLRAVAVAPVILFHAGAGLFAGGFVGVDVFFVISGYLITTIIVTELEQDSFSILSFYERRARRILPALFVVLAVSLVLAWFILGPRQMKDFAEGLISVALFSSNILFWQSSGYFDTAAEFNPLLHTWSLAVEEQYYIFFPLLLMAIWRRGTHFVLATLIGLFLLSLGLAQWGAYNKPVAAFFLLPTRGWELLLGAFCALWLKRGMPAYSPMSNAAGLIGLILILWAVFIFDEATPTPSIYTLIPTLGTALVILFAVPGTLANRLLGGRLLVWVGLISYSAYLWHQPLFAFARQHLGTVHLPFVLSSGLVVATFVLAVLTWRFVEAPFRSKTRFSRDAIFGFSGAGLASIVLVGGLAIALNGNLFRFTPNQMRIWGNLDIENAFVWDAKDRLRHSTFDDPSRQNILVIGDSTSGDALNVLMALEGADAYEFSTLLIQSGCGNLALPKALFEDQIAPDNISRCAVNDSYDSPLSQSLLNAADLVILASSWRPWEAALIAQSLARLEAGYGAKFTVIGRKDLDLAGRDIIGLPEDALAGYTVPPSALAGAVNARLKDDLQARFVDFYPLFCAQDQCRLFDAQKNILLHDGIHLSRAGVAFLSERLRGLETLTGTAALLD